MSSGTQQAHAGFAYHPSHIVAGREPQEQSALAMEDHSYSDEEKSRSVQGQSTRSIKKNMFLLQDKTGREHGKQNNASTHAVSRVDCDDPICSATHVGYRPFRHSVSCSKQGSEQSRQILGLNSTPNTTSKADVCEKPGTDTRPVLADADSVHCHHHHHHHHHHSPDFHDHHHSAGRLSPAVSHKVYNLHEGHSEEGTEPALEEGNKRSSHLEPLTKPKSVTQVDSFQWTRDTISPNYLCHSDNGGEQLSTVTNAASNHHSRVMSNETSDTALREPKVYREKTEAHDHDDSERFQSDNRPPKLRLASTPSWLRDPNKEAADATAPLRHINTKNHEAHEHSHGYLSNITVDNRREQDHLSSTTHDFPPLTPEVPKTPRATPNIQIDPASPKRKQATTVSVSKRREIFEAAEGHTDKASSTKEASHVRNTHSRQAQREETASTTQGGLSQSHIEG
ncbi:hypothetical protein SAMD00023353_3700690 [Rosellinia necatrix]|uniref:Uncharacterized protein n=1 Tax=Rosellinia necatrix TaxID=77044 RepID=A0A1S8A8Z3_ROSNE|nr:hypothetical protein SAMD00023353_3700690 [Rosellinia necatrix]